MFALLWLWACTNALMPRTVNAGIYPVYARLICASIATGVNWTMDVIVSLTFLALAGNMSKYRSEDDLPIEDRVKEIKNQLDGVF